MKGTVRKGITHKQKQEEVKINMYRNMPTHRLVFIGDRQVEVVSRPQHLEHDQTEFEAQPFQQYPNNQTVFESFLVPPPPPPPRRGRINFHTGQSIEDDTVNTRDQNS